uniref:Transmembrane protein n=1 Tax=Brassica oleracea var. oleracea TaxID=109376 RepID=A0A0D3AQY8_BRAOL
MITRSKLAEQLREYQIKSKHDWASVSLFSSSSNFSSSSSRLESCARLQLIIWTMVLCNSIGIGGCGSLCYLGTGDLSVPGVFSCLIVLEAVGTRVHLALCLLTIVRLYENRKA